MSSKKLMAVIALSCLLACSASIWAQAQPASQQTSVATTQPAFDVNAATEQWLAKMPPQARASSDAYYEGGYWLILWDFLAGAAVSLLLLFSRWSAKMRDWAERITRFKPLQTAVYWTEYVIISSILVFPLTVYEGYIREHQYGLANQSFGPWMGDQLKGLLLGIILGAILMVPLWEILRRLERTWWIWGAFVTMLALTFLVVITPVYLVPIFNKVTPLNDPKVTVPILSMARANGINVHDVYMVDASKQSKRMSANVSGLFNTERITLNDNLLKRGSPEEIQAVMGHEMGHYVMHHIYEGLMFNLIETVVLFAFLRWSLGWCLQRWGGRWQVHGISDLAIIPLGVLLFSLYGFVSTPIDNTYTRTQEAEADMYGLNAARQPDGMAEAALHLGEYRKMSPGPVEEWLFYDHPSGRNRIYTAMRWKAEHLSECTGLPVPSASPSPAAVTTTGASKQLAHLVTANAFVL